MRKAFTIMEILISVIIISIAILFVLKISTNNQEQILYILDRNNRALEDSLYIKKENILYHKENKTALEILEKSFKIKKDETKNLLKESNRSIFAPEPIEIEPPEDMKGAPTLYLQELLLKGRHSSKYYYFSLV